MKSLPIDQKKLKEFSRLCNHYNVDVLLLNHYIDQQSKNPIDVIGTELRNETREILEILDKAEIQDLVSNFPRHLQSIVSRNSGEDYDFEILAFSYLIYELLQFKFSIANIVKPNPLKSEIFNIYPELSKYFDDDNLLTLNDEFQFAFDGLKYKDHLLFFHQFFRRGFYGSHNVDFLHRFAKYYHDSVDNTFRIALDHNRIMPYEFYQRTLEFDTWYGYPFNISDIDNRKKVGLTVVKRNEYYPYDFYNTLDRTEFLWTFKEPIKTFQIEEISNSHHTHEHFNLNKYIHSERNILTQQLTHFDGAVKVYLQNQYEKRFSTDLKGDSKGQTKIKLFRIDGNINLEIWSELINYFYRGNEMLIEYFNPEQFEKQYREVIEANRNFEQSEKADNMRFP